MTPIPPLSPDRLYRACDTGHFTFTTTAELDDLSEGIGQMRAIDAAHFGIGMPHAGSNLYVMGQPGILHIDTDGERVGSRRHTAKDRH